MKSKRLIAVLLTVFNIIFLFSYKAEAASVTERLSGQDRYKTAVEISKAGWQAAENVVLATGENFPDALCAAPLARQLNGPILLTEGDLLNSDTAAEIARLGARKVYIIGGSGVISDNVMSAIKSKGLQCERLWGENRYMTALEVAAFIKGKFKVSSEIAVTIGEDFPDALSISPIAAQKGMIMLLVPKDYIPDAIDMFIKNSGFTKTHVIGGSDIITDAAAAQLPDAQRITGRDKYERNVNILKKFAGDVNPSTIYVATGENFPDALAGSVLAPKDSSAIILTSNVPAQSTRDYIDDNIHRIQKLKALGGDGVVPLPTLQELSSKSTVNDKVPLTNPPTPAAPMAPITPIVPNAPEPPAAPVSPVNNTPTQSPHTGPNPSGTTTWEVPEDATKPWKPPAVISSPEYQLTPNGVREVIHPTPYSPEGNMDRTVYYVQNGKSYHYDKNCSTLSRSIDILEGKLRDVINLGKSDPCDKCAH